MTDSLLCCKCGKGPDKELGDVIAVGDWHNAMHRGCRDKLEVCEPPYHRLDCTGKCQ